MISAINTNSEHPDFIRLVRLLDADLDTRYGVHQEFYSQFNKLDTIHHVIIVYWDGDAVACGAIRQYSNDTMEIKRMFVDPRYRGQGIGKIVLNSLERWATELGYSYCILESGNKQPEALALYERVGYARIPNYGQYASDENSVCMKKQIGRE